MTRTVRCSTRSWWIPPTDRVRARPSLSVRARSPAGGRAGLTEVGLDARFQQIHGDDAESRWWRLSLEQSRVGTVAAGLVEEADFEAAYREMAQPDFHDLSLAVLTAWGRAAG